MGFGAILWRGDWAAFTVSWSSKSKIVAEHPICGKFAPPPLAELTQADQDALLIDVQRDSEDAMDPDLKQKSGTLRKVKVILPAASDEIALERLTEVDLLVGLYGKDRHPGDNDAQSHQRMVRVVASHLDTLEGPDINEFYDPPNPQTATRCGRELKSCVLAQAGQEWIFRT